MLYSTTAGAWFSAAMGTMGSIAFLSNAIALAASLWESIEDCYALIMHRMIMKAIPETTAMIEKIQTIAGFLVTIVLVVYSVC